MTGIQMDTMTFFERKGLLGGNWGKRSKGAFTSWGGRGKIRTGRPCVRKKSGDMMWL